MSAGVVLFVLESPEKLLRLESWIGLWTQWLVVSCSECLQPVPKCFSSAGFLSVDTLETAAMTQILES